MPSPPIQVFLTTIASQPALRQRQEYILRILQVKKIQFTSYDLASDDNAKRLWKRKAPPNKQQLPGILVGGVFPGSFEDFEEAVEYAELDTFLRLKESWDPELDMAPALPAQPIGVPGASSPLQMTNQKPSFAPTPSPLKDKSKLDSEVDAGDLLGDKSLQGIGVTDDELADLVKELGLEGEEAGDLVKGLKASKDPEPQAEPEADVPSAKVESSRKPDTTEEKPEEHASEAEVKAKEEETLKEVDKLKE